MGALQIERDDELLRVTLARPETRNAFDADADRRARGGVRRRRQGARGRAGRRRAELLRGRRRRVDARVGRPRLRLQRRRRERAPRDAGGDRPLSCARRRARAGSRARRRSRARCLRGHRRRGREGRLRVLGGEARDHPGRDLAVRARQDRAERGPALLRHRRALRRGDRAPDRARARGRRRSRRRRRATCSPSSANAGPRAARHAKQLVLDRPDGPETARRIAERRTSDEGRKACAPSSSAARRPGRANAQNLAEPACRPACYACAEARLRFGTWIARPSATRPGLLDRLGERRVGGHAVGDRLDGRLGVDRDRRRPRSGR